MLPVDRIRDRPLPEGEPWPAPQPHRERRHEAGEVVATPKRKRWWRVAGDISDKTRLVVTWGGAIIVASALFFAGTIWSDFRGALAKNNEQDARLTKMEDRFTALERQLSELGKDQAAAAKDSSTAARVSTAVLWALGDLRVVLAEHGIRFDVPDPNDPKLKTRTREE